MKTSIFFLLFSALMACAAKDKQSTQTTDTASVVQAEPSGVADDILKEKGLLKEVEDSGYPFATLTIEFPERKMTEYFTVNLEETKDADINTLRKWVGRYVSFGYTSEPSSALLDVQVNGKSIVSDEKLDLEPELKQIKGVLSGADEETPGDLPGKVTITAKNMSITFEFFVTKNMVPFNGKTVVGFYEERTENIIKSIKVMPK